MALTGWWLAPFLILQCGLVLFEAKIELLMTAVVVTTLATDNLHLQSSTFKQQQKFE